MEHDTPQGGEHQVGNEKHEQLTPPRIYVASLADYVDGRLHGSWLDVSGDPDELAEGIQAVLATSRLPGAEEWAIHDYEGFAPLRLGEHESLERIARIGRGITTHGEAFKHWAAITGSARLDDRELRRRLPGPLGEHDGVLREHLGRPHGYDQVLDQAVPDGLRGYVRFDAEALGRDLELGGDITTSEGDGGVYIFWARG